jgi:DNA mismatch repair protein MutL
VSIRRLPETLVNQIAAGEVVERPAAALKELIENALDAGARRIQATLIDGGQSLIAVEDDGRGMTPAELELAVERHATSKLPDDDLTHIRTLGFRGEALPSIGAVSRLTITSRPPEAAEAWRIRIEGGRRAALEPAAHPAGTRVEVRDLFYATPARLKFLKAPRTELTHAVEAAERLALAHPQVAFTISDGARDVLRLEAETGFDDAARLRRLSALLGRDFAANALAVDARRETIGHEAVRLFGHIGLPTFNRATAREQFLVVNGRPVRDKLLFGAVRGAYQNLLAGDRHPVVALFLELPLDEVDVNVHPMKTEVRFRDAGQVRGMIVGALRDALARAGHRAASTVGTATLGAFRPGGSGSGHGGGSLSPGLAARGAAAGFGPDYAFPPTSGGGLAEAAQGFIDAPSFADALAAPAARAEPATDGTETDPIDFPLGAARAQLHGTYILSQTRDGMVIVDQHAAHERLLFERMKAALANGGIKRQGLLIPEVVELPPGAADRLAERAAELAELGLVLERFGEGAVLVREIPALLGDTDLKGLVRDLADEIAELGAALSLKERLGEICGTLACHASVRAGRRLNAGEMNALLRQMEVTPHAGQCNHGRPTYVELKLGDIERLFGRK